MLLGSIWESATSFCMSHGYKARYLKYNHISKVQKYSYKQSSDWYLV